LTADCRTLLHLSYFCIEVFLLSKNANAHLTAKKSLKINKPLQTDSFLKEEIAWKGGEMIACTFP
jgi:hypothetical protein